MANYNDVECFMYYMYNRWCLDESIALFGERLGEHIFKKFVNEREYSHNQTMSWYGELDKTCRDKLYARAKEIYSNNN